MNQFILCCVSATLIKDHFIEDLKKLLSTHHCKIQKTHHLTQPQLKALELTLEVAKDFDAQNIKLSLMELSNAYQVDMALMPDDEGRINKKLIVFDMDSTLIQHEVIDEMAEVHGIGDKVKLITDKAMKGELNFNEALIERVSLLKGLKRKEMEDVMSRLKLTEGVEKLIKVLKQEGYKTAIISGGFKFFAESFRQKLGMDYAFANDLEFENDVLTGKVKGQIINAEVKAQLLEEVATKEGFKLKQVVAVGDGANDLPMLLKAGFGIAFHAKEKVRKAANHQMSHGPMTSILYFLGIPGDHFYESI